MSNTYKKVVEILTSGKEIDRSAFFEKLAEDHPEVFIDIYSSLYEAAHPEASEYLGLIINDRKFDCIKKFCVDFNIGLKEAKDVTDNLHNALLKAGRISRTSYDAFPLNDVTQPIYKSIAKAITSIY